MRSVARLALTTLALALLVFWARAQAQGVRVAYLPQVAQPVHPSATAAPTQAQVPVTNVKINDVVCREPTDDPTVEYIELVNNEASEVSLISWRIVNATTKMTYTFPPFLTRAGGHP